MQLNKEISNDLSDILPELEKKYKDNESKIQMYYGKDGIKIVYDDLVNSLKEWKGFGDRLLVVGDFNEDCQKGKLRQLRTGKDLVMLEVMEGIKIG